MSPRAAVRRLPDHDDRPATVRDVRRLIDDALLSLVGEQREREQRRHRGLNVIDDLRAILHDVLPDPVPVIPAAELRAVAS